MNSLLQEALAEFEQVASAQRHALRNTLAASRLLTGAYALWEIDDSAYRRAFTQLKKIDAVAIDLNDHFDAMREHRPHRPKGGATPLARQFKSSPCLVVDDQLETAGWRATFEAILGPTTRFARSKEDALRCLADEAATVSLVLLDLGLPSATDGLEALAMIKSRHLDLPVVVFSAFDDIPLARKCFQGGASGYYVKELENVERNSIAYYRKFKEVLDAALPDTRLRQLWSEISALRGRIPQEASGARIATQVVRSFERAWFFLSSDDQDPRLRLLFHQDAATSANVFSHGLIEAMMSLELLIETTLDSLESDRRRGARGTLLEQAVRVSRPTMVNKLRALRERRLLSPAESEEAERMWEMRSRVVHGRRRVDRSYALSQVSGLLKICQKLLPK
jgi:CheY-like chemotaxis protein